MGNFVLNKKQRNVNEEKYLESIFSELPTFMSCICCKRKYNEVAINKNLKKYEEIILKEKNLF